MDTNIKLNYYALFIAIVKGMTAKEALLSMCICPDNERSDKDD